jgi:hypothetical protein
LKKRAIADLKPYRALVSGRSLVLTKDTPKGIIDLLVKTKEGKNGL